MRGSPLIRSIILAFALVVTAAVLARVTATPTRAVATSTVPLAEKTAVNSVPFHLTLSALATEIEIDTGKILPLPVTGSTLSGTLEIDPANPQIGLRIRWKSSVAHGEHRFAKLILEPPNRATVTHIFDAAGDIDDFLELPLSFLK